MKFSTDLFDPHKSCLIYKISVKMAKNSITRTYQMKIIEILMLCEDTFIK